MKKLLLAFLILLTACAPKIAGASNPTPTPIILPTLPFTPSPTPTPIVVSPTPSPTPSGNYVVEPGDTLWSISQKVGVPEDYLAAQNQIDNPDLIFTGQILMIPNWPPDPPTPDTNDKEIIVQLSLQRACAAQNGAILKCVLVSTGVPAYPTPIGHFQIYAKARFLDMKGPGYNLPNVPFDLCFLPTGLGYCIHGTYWHHNFGHPMSHGCVNLSIPDAEWLYGWAKVGTPVLIIP